MFREISESDLYLAELLEVKVIEIQCGGAHLNGIAGDDRFENVAWLCRGCHLRHDAWQHKLTREINKDFRREMLQEMVA